MGDKRRLPLAPASRQGFFPTSPGPGPSGLREVGMKRLLAALSVLLALAFAFPLTLQDDLGRTVTLQIGRAHV